MALTPGEPRSWLESRWVRGPTLAKVIKNLFFLCHWRSWLIS